MSPSTERLAAGPHSLRPGSPRAPRRAWRSPRYWVDRVLATDPGLERLHLGMRAMLGAGLTLLVLYYAGRAAGHSPRAALIAVSLAMMSALLVQDALPAQQKLTTMLLALPAGAGLAAGTLVAPHPIAREAALLGTVFAAVFVRRFGSRATTLGMAGFFGFFDAVFFHAAPSELPWALGTVLVACACAYAVRFALLPDRPAAILRGSARAFDARTRVLLAQLADAAQDLARGAPWPPALRVQFERLNEQALALEGRLAPDAPPGAYLPDADDADLRARVFDVELCLARVSANLRRCAAAGALDVADARLVADALWSLRDGPASTPALRDERPACRRLARALTALDTALRRARAAPAAPAPAAIAAIAAGRPANTPRGIHPATRQAVQATVAAALALQAGQWLSPVRWYWAVLASFVVFTRTESIGETVRKATQRLTGTLAGVVAGLALVHALHGHARLELSLVFACVVLGYYMIRVSYAWMVAAVTTLLAALYDLMGMFSPSLLYLRVGETALGVGIAAAVSVLVLPARTSHRVRDAAAAALRALGEQMALVGRRCAGRGAAPGEVFRAARELDRAIADLRAAALPAERSVIPLASAVLTHQVALVASLGYWSHRLSPALEPALRALALDARVALGDAAVALAQSASSVAAALASGEAVPAVASCASVLDRVVEPEPAAGGDAREGDARAAAVLVLCLRQVDNALLLLSDARGAARAQA